MTDQWFAGFFDGEGCVRLAAHGHGRYAGRYLIPTLTLAQKDRRVLKEVQTRYGGRLYRCVRRAGTVCSHLRWNGKEAVRIARLLLPLSICKKQQLQVLLDAAELRSRDRPTARDELTRLKKDIET